MNRGAPACAFLIAFTIAAAPCTAAAPAYPTKPIRLVSPYPAGGPNDIIARVVAPKMGEQLGQQVIVDNRGGAAGALGAELAAKAPRDGYTLLLGQASNLAINVSLSKLPYDPVADFAPISLVGKAASVMVVHPSVPAQSVKALVAVAKSKPGVLNYASAGSGGTAHLNTELFMRAAGIKMVHIPYKGGAAALNSVLGGETAVYITSPLSAHPPARAGKLRMLAVTGPSRLALLPQVPTFVESGYPSLDSTSFWAGIVAPAGVPPEIIQRLNGVIVTALRDEEVRKRMAAQGIEASGSSPAELGAFIKSEITKWGALIREIGIKPQ